MAKFLGLITHFDQSWCKIICFQQQIPEFEIYIKLKIICVIFNGHILLISLKKEIFLFNIQRNFSMFIVIIRNEKNLEFYLVFEKFLRDESFEKINVIQLQLPIHVLHAFYRCENNF